MKFSDFIRNATPEEKEAVYLEVLQKATQAQNAVTDEPDEPDCPIHGKTDGGDCPRC